MTTFVFEGINVQFTEIPGTNDDEVTAVRSPAELRLVVENADATFTYQYLDDNGNPTNNLQNVTDPNVDIDGEVQMAAVNNQNIDQLEDDFGNGLELEFGVVSRAAGESTFLGLSLETSTGQNEDFFFIVDGVPFPDIQTVDDFNSFSDSINNVGLESGSLGPNRTIKWADLDYALLTEDDEFVGTDGRDRFEGGIGDDFFISSEGRDTYIGGADFDQVSYRGDPGGVTAHLGKKTATDGFGGTDTLNSIESLRGSMFDDKFTGSGKSDSMRGLQGEDVLNGGKGVDRVRYDRDERYGGDDGVTVNLQKGFAIDGFGDRDTVRNFENVTGSEMNDSLIGNGGKNLLLGLGGNDTLNGLGGKDTLDGAGGKDKINGGGGNDQMTGGGGNDRFVFTGKFGDDTITDFATKGNKEKIDLSGVNSIKNFKDLKKNHLSNDNGDAVIDDGNGNTITLDNLLKADLSANDFVF